MSDYSLKTKLIAAGLLLAALLFGLWRVYDIGYNRGENARQAIWNAAEQQRAKEIEMRRLMDQDAADNIDAEATPKYEAEKKRGDRLQEELNAERRKNRAYRDCVVPADGVRLYNDAIRSKGPDQSAGDR